MAICYDFVAIGPFCWGRGSSTKAAINQLKRSWCNRYDGKFSKQKIKMWMVHPDTIVNYDGLGGMRYPIGNKPAEIKDF